MYGQENMLHVPGQGNRLHMPFVGITSTGFITDPCPKNRLLWIVVNRFWLGQFPVTRPREYLFLLTGIHNKRFMDLWFGVICWWYGGSGAKRRSIRYFKLHSKTYTVTFHKNSCPFIFEVFISFHCIARICNIK